MKLSDDDKIQIVTSILIDRKKTKDVCDQWQICKETVNQLVAYYKQHGADGISRTRNKGTYSREFKSDVIEYIMQSHDSLRNAAIRFNVAKSDVRQWYLLFKEKGSDAFGTEKRGSKVPGGRHRGIIPQDVRVSEAASCREGLEKLRKCNAYLEMENEFLKNSMP